MNEHGATKIRWFDDILFIEAYCGFSREGVDHFCNLMQESIKSKNLTHWGRMEILSNDTMAIPEAIDFLKSTYLWGADNGCYATAIVSKNEKMLEIIFTNESLNVRVFSNLAKATKWIRSINRQFLG